jgi:hypothetical protein
VRVLDSGRPGGHPPRHRCATRGRGVPTSSTPWSR